MSEGQVQKDESCGTQCSPGGGQIGGTEAMANLQKSTATLQDQQAIAELENLFTYHAPKGNQQERYVALRNCAKEFARLVLTSCPNSRERSLAITAIQQATQWANASIAIRE